MNATFKSKFRNKMALADMKRNRSRTGYLEEGLGIWSRTGKGWYTGEIIEHCYNVGLQDSAGIYCSREQDPEGQNAFYFLGIDPSKGDDKSSADGALVNLRAVPRILSVNGDDITLY